MINIPDWVSSLTNEKGKPDYCDFYYTKCKGVAAEVQYKAAVKRMKAQPWWQEHVKIHGKEPQLPAINK